MQYYVYIVRCADGTFYTGITNHLQRRLQSHNEGKGAKYTRARLPVRLCYVETGEGRSWASKREREIQRLTRAQKKRLIEQGGGHIDIAGAEE